MLDLLMCSYKITHLLKLYINKVSVYAYISNAVDVFMKGV